MKRPLPDDAAAADWHGPATVSAVTPDDGLYIHRFFDTSPWSPSGRCLVVLRLPFQDREPEPGDSAEVCVVDLVERTIETIAETRAWCMQMGAQQQWGADDRFVYFNDVIDGAVAGIRYDREDRRATRLEGSIYQVSPCGRFAVSPDLHDVHVSQSGYGVTPPAARRRLRRGAEGRVLWRTDLDSGRREVLATFEELLRCVPDSRELRRSALLGFHVKFNLQGDRLLFVLRAMETRLRNDRFKRRPMLLTLRADGGDAMLAMPYQDWEKGGHHPNWHPDGRRCLMNLKLDGVHMRFVEFRCDGGDRRIIAGGVIGSGHPSWSRDGRFIVTDAYVSDTDVLGASPPLEGAVPLRLIDAPRGLERVAAWIPVANAGRGALRCDPHPAWNGSFTKVCFNAAPDGRRRVFIADLAPLLADEDSERR